MGTTGLKTNKSTIDTWLHPDAPKLYPKGRECEKCSARVSRYTTPYVYQKPERTVLLCSPCDYARRSTDLDALEFVGRKKTKNLKKRRYTSKPGNTAGILLPGLAIARIRWQGQGMSSDELSRKVSCSKGHLRDVEGGRQRASRELARRFARQLGVTIAELESEAKEEMSAELAS